MDNLFLNNNKRGINIASKFNRKKYKNKIKNKDKNQPRVFLEEPVKLIDPVVDGSVIPPQLCDTFNQNDMIIIYKLMESFSKNEAQMFSLPTVTHAFSDSDRVLIDRAVASITGSIDRSTENLSNTVSDATNIMEVLNATMNNICSGGLPGPTVNIKHSFDWFSPETRRVALWLSLLTSYMCVQKYPNERMPKVFLMVSIAAVLYLESDRIRKFALSLFSMFAQTDKLLDLIVEGTSIFVFGVQAMNLGGSYSKLAESLGRLNATSEGFSKYVLRVIDWLKDMAQVMAECLGHQLHLDDSVFDTEYQDIVTEFKPIKRKLIDGEKVRNEDYQKVSVLFDRIQSLHNKIILRKERGTPTEMPVRILLTELSSAYERLREVCTNMGARLYEPWVCLIVGYPGCGKDTALGALAAIFTYHSLDDDEKLNWEVNRENYTPYIRNSADPYFSNYNNNTPLIQISDAFQVESKPGDQMSEESIIIHLLSGEPYNLPQAIAEDKGKKWAKPRAVVMTSNWSGGNSREFKSVTDAGAIHRRFANSAWIQYIAPEYVLKDSKGQPVYIKKIAKGFSLPLSDEECKRYCGKLDTEKIQRDVRLNGVDYNACYRYRAFNTVDGLPFGPEMTSKEFITLQVKSLRAHIFTKTELAHAMEDYVNNLDMNSFIDMEAETLGDDIRTAFNDVKNVVLDVGTVVSDYFLNTQFEYNYRRAHGHESMSYDRYTELMRNNLREYISRLEPVIKITAKNTIEEATKRRNEIRKELSSRFNDLLDYAYSIHGSEESDIVYGVKPEINVTAIDPNKVQDSYHLRAKRIFVAMFNKFCRMTVRGLKNLMVAKDYLTYFAAYNLDAHILYSESQTSETWFQAFYRYGVHYLDNVRTNIREAPHSWWGAIRCGLMVYSHVSLVLAGYDLIKSAFSLFFGGDTKHVKDDSSKFVSQAFPAVTQTDKFMNKIVKNVFNMSILVIDNSSGEFVEKELNYITMVKSRFGLTVKHCFDDINVRYLNDRYTVFLLLYSSTGIGDNVKPDYRVDYKSIKFKNTSNDDIVIVEFPLTVREFPDITHHIPDDSNKELMRKLYAETRSCTYRYCDKGQHVDYTGIASVAPQMRYSTPTTFTDLFTGITDTVPEKNFVVKNALSTGKSFKGACGLPIFVQVKNFSSLTNPFHTAYANQPFIAWMHVSGNAFFGMGAPLVYSMVKDIESSSYVEPYHRLLSTMDAYSNVAKKYDIFKESDVPVESLDLSYHGTGQDLFATRIRPSFSRPTEIVKSALYKDPKLEEFFFRRSPEILSDRPVPASLKNYRDLETDTYIPVSHKAWAPYGQNTNGVLSDEANRKLLHVFASNLLNKNGNYKVPPLMIEPDNLVYLHEMKLDYDHPKLNSLMEGYMRVVKGYQSDDPMLHRTCLDRTKSVGYSIQNSTDLHSRADIYGTNVFPELGSPEEMFVRDMYQDMCMKLIAGEDITVIMKGCLKDECRPMSRVIAGKTRLFSNGDWVFLVLNSVLLGDCIYTHKSRRFYNNMLVGTNPHDVEEWTKFAQKLLAFNDRIGATDHSGFDTDCREQDFQNFTTYMSMYYQKAPDFVAERMLLLKSMFNYIMVISDSDGDRYFSMTRALCSGWLITSLFGSFKNAYSHYVAFMSIAAKSEFGDKELILNTLDINQIMRLTNIVDKEIQGYYYGDDGIIAPIDTSKYSIPKICKEMNLLLGSRLTNENDDVDEDGYVPLDRCTIIARSFRPMIVNDELKYFANLRFVSIYKMLYWDNKKAPHDSIIQKIDLALRETARHGEEVHNEFVRAIQDSVKEKYNYVSPFYSWHFALSEGLGEIYQPYDGDEFVKLCDA